MRQRHAGVWAEMHRDRSARGRLPGFEFLASSIAVRRLSVGLGASWKDLDSVARSSRMIESFRVIRTIGPLMDAVVMADEVGCAWSREAA
jgi:hypothetical protein